MPTKKKIDKVWHLHVMGHTAGIDGVLSIFRMSLYHF